ncbi:2592_t:CDS:2, partial [Scutellospora calospora]
MCPDQARCRCRRRQKSSCSRHARLEDRRGIRGWNWHQGSSSACCGDGNWEGPRQDTLEEELVAIAGEELGAFGRDGRNGGDKAEQEGDEDGEQHLRVGAVLGKKDEGKVECWWETGRMNGSRSVVSSHGSQLPVSSILDGTEGAHGTQTAI